MARGASPLRLPAVYGPAPDAPACTAHRDERQHGRGPECVHEADRCVHEKIGVPAPAFTVPGPGHDDPQVWAQPARASARLDGEGLPGLPPAAPIMAWP